MYSYSPTALIALGKSLLSSDEETAHMFNLKDSSYIELAKLFITAKAIEELKFSAELETDLASGWSMKIKGGQAGIERVTKSILEARPTPTVVTETESKKPTEVRMAVSYSSAQPAPAQASLAAEGLELIKASKHRTVLLSELKACFYLHPEAENERFIAECLVYGEAVASLDPTKQRAFDDLKSMLSTPTGIWMANVYLHNFKRWLHEYSLRAAAPEAGPSVSRATPAAPSQTVVARDSSAAAAAAPAKQSQHWASRSALCGAFSSPSARRGAPSGEAVSSAVTPSRALPAASVAPAAATANPVAPAVTAAAPSAVR